jgi:hypothetical protein
MDAQAPEGRESLELFGLFGNCNSPTYRLGMHMRILMDCERLERNWNDLQRKRCAQ